MKGRNTGRKEQQKRGTVGKIGTSVGRTKDSEEQGKRRTVKMETGEETGAERNLGGSGGTVELRKDWKGETLVGRKTRREEQRRLAAGEAATG